jgi:predicted negative regulator of RcsB-dependent stress response
MSTLQDDVNAQALKAWWNKHGKQIIIAVVAVLVVFYGIRFIQAQKVKVASSASAIYDEYQEAIANNDLLALDASYAVLVEDFSKTPYASAVSLIEGARAANTGKLEDAQEKLQWVLDKGSDFAKPIAKLRMAELLVQQQDFAAAYALLDGVDANSPYKPAYSELQGDILLLQGDVNQALQLYQVALQEYREQGIDNVLLQFKLQTYAPEG